MEKDKIDQLIDIAKSINNNIKLISVALTQDKVWGQIPKNSKKGWWGLHPDGSVEHWNDMGSEDSCNNLEYVKSYLIKAGWGEDSIFECNGRLYAEHRMGLVYFEWHE